MRSGRLRHAFVGFGLIGFAVVLVSCSSLPKPEISAGIREQFHISEIEVSSPENSELWWGEAERELAAQECVTFSDTGQGSISMEEYAKKPETRAYVASKITGIVKEAVTKKVTGVLTGPKPAKLMIEVRALRIASAAQRVLVGGHHGLTVDAWLVDPASGQELNSRQQFGAFATGGEGVVGVLTDQIINAAANDPVYRLADQIGDKTQAWLRPEPS